MECSRGNRENGEIMEYVKKGVGSGGEKRGIAKSLRKARHKPVVPKQLDAMFT